MKDGVMGISTVLTGFYVACLLRAIGYWMRICKAQGTDSLFIDYFPLVFYVGILEPEAIEGVVIVVAILFCAPRTSYFSILGVTLGFWSGISVRRGLLMET